jgi:hypothetical protein
MTNSSGHGAMDGYRGQNPEGLVPAPAAKMSGSKFGREFIYRKNCPARTPARMAWTRGIEETSGPVQSLVN